MNSLAKGPVSPLLGRSVVVSDPEGREFSGSIEEASSKCLTVRYTTGHKAQFSQVRLFRRSNLHGYDAGWSVRPAVLEVPALSPVMTQMVEAPLHS